MSEKAPDLNERKEHAERLVELSVRAETAADKSAVHDVNVAAFGREKEAKLVDALRASDAFIPELSLVAERDGKVVGYILFTKIEIVGHSDHRCVAIGPVSVDPNAQKQGIGSELIQNGIEKAKAQGYDSVILLGHPEYYPRFGFKPASQWGITTAYNAPQATFALELKEGSLQGKTGQARYAKEFAENDC